MPKRAKPKAKDPASGRFVKQRTDDGSEAEALFNSEYDERERSQENEERMMMEREDENVARSPRWRICINGASYNLQDSDIYDDNDDEQQQPAFDPNEAGPSQPVLRRIINLARLQGEQKEQLDARHRQEAAELARVTAELAETHRRLSASRKAFPPSRSEEDDHNPDAEAFVDAEMTDAEMSHAYEQHVPIPAVDPPMLIRSSESMGAAAPVADRPELVRSSSAGASQRHRVANRGQTFRLENLVLVRIPEPHAWRNRDTDRNGPLYKLEVRLQHSTRYDGSPGDTHYIYKTVWRWDGSDDLVDEGIRTFVFPLERAHYDNDLSWPEVYIDISTAQHVGFVEHGATNPHLRKVPSPFFWRNRDGSFVWPVSDVPAMQVKVDAGNGASAWQSYYRYRHHLWDPFGVLPTIPVVGRVTDISIMTVPWTGKNRHVRLPRVNTC